MMIGDKSVAFICDRKQCENCSYPLCDRTFDINHAVNFAKYSEYYLEYRRPEEENLGIQANQYQSMALRTANQELSSDEMLLDGLMGLCGEAGEAIDILKKARFQGHELDQKHLAKELGDVAWYLAVASFAIDMSLDEIFRENIQKLKERYPDGFSIEKSVERKEGDI